MAMDSIASCANDSVRALCALWDTIGVDSAERGVLLARVAAEVEAVYKSRVGSERLRQECLLGEIQALRTTISDMMVSLEESVVVPEPAGRPLLPFRDALEATRAQLQETWDARSALLRSREAQVFQLCADIGAGIEGGFASLGDRISAQRIAAYDGEIARLSAIKAARAAEVGGLAGEIKELWEELGFAPGDAAEGSIGRGALEELGWGLPIIATLKGKVAALSAEKAAREEKITIMGQGITTLWKRLATPEEEQTAFLEAHAGIGDDVINACEIYLTRKQEEFAGRLVELIACARASIEALWKEMRMGPSERQAAFPGFFAPPSAFNDDLFLAHEAYAERAAALAEQVRPIIKAIEKREALLADKAEYEVIISDPNRLIKGSSSARLREEKLERRVKKELPVFNKRLRVQCCEWEASRGGEPFLVEGARFVDVLDAEEAGEARAVANARSVREARNRGGEEEGAGGAAAAAAAAGPAAAGGSSAASSAAPLPAAAQGGGGSRATSNPRASVALSMPKFTREKAGSSSSSSGAGEENSAPTQPSRPTAAAVKAAIHGKAAAAAAGGASSGRSSTAAAAHFQPGPVPIPQSLAAPSQEALAGAEALLQSL